jgi:hypothetical protein
VSRYGADHKAIRRQRHLAVGQPCCRCGKVIQPGDSVDLDHNDDGLTYRGWAHTSCNRSAGGKRGAMLNKFRKLHQLADVVLGVEISRDRSRTSIVAAGLLEDDAVGFELVDYLAGADTAPAVKAAVDKRQAVAVVIDAGGPANTLIAPLQALKVQVTKVSGTDVPLACHMFLDEAEAGRVRRLSKHSALEAAFKNAELRPRSSGDVPDRYRSPEDVGPAYAAVFALWAVKHPKPKPGLGIWVTSLRYDGGHVVNTPLGPQVAYPLGPQ